MTAFHTMPLPTTPTVVAPDGSDVRILLGLQGVAGRGEMWPYLGRGALPL